MPKKKTIISNPQDFKRLDIFAQKIQKVNQEIKKANKKKKEYLEKQKVKKIPSEELKKERRELVELKNKIKALENENRELKGKILSDEGCKMEENVADEVGDLHITDVEADLSTYKEMQDHYVDFTNNDGFEGDDYT